MQFPLTSTTVRLKGNFLDSHYSSPSSRHDNIPFPDKNAHREGKEAFNSEFPKTPWFSSRASQLQPLVQATCVPSQTGQRFLLSLCREDFWLHRTWLNSKSSHSRQVAPYRQRCTHRTTLLACHTTRASQHPLKAKPSVTNSTGYILQI